MKYIISILILFICINVSAQTSDTCFTEQEVQDISFTLDSLYYLDSVNTKIIEEQKTIIKDQETLVRLDSVENEFKQKKIILLQDNVSLYQQREKWFESEIIKLQPKWYDQKAIWFAGGIITTLLTGQMIVTIILH
jgi:hypothetical protein